MALVVALFAGAQEQQPLPKQSIRLRFAESPFYQQAREVEVRNVRLIKVITRSKKMPGTINLSISLSNLETEGDVCAVLAKEFSAPTDLKALAMIHRPPNLISDTEFSLSVTAMQIFSNDKQLNEADLYRAFFVQPKPAELHDAYVFRRAPDMMFAGLSKPDVEVAKLFPQPSVTVTSADAGGSVTVERPGTDGSKPYQVRWIKTAVPATFQHAAAKELYQAKAATDDYLILTPSGEGKIKVRFKYSDKKFSAEGEVEGKPCETTLEVALPQ